MSGSDTHAAHLQSSDRRRVLTTAVLNAARIMGLRQAQLARILGVSEATVSRMKQGAWQPTEHSKTWELAALLVRLFRGLDALMASDDRALQSWLHSRNQALGDAPVNLLHRVEGLVRTVEYVDAYR
ncbi:MAG TPA: helix-turn-helix domain-containing protein, partial [Chromatiales bacterium]|nr:helix-turn-helix domain-containing protein [Chromatiales bacterium]